MKSRKAKIWIGILVVAAALMAWFIYMLNSSAAGTIKKSPSQAAIETAKKPGELKGERFQTKYPGGYATNSRAPKDKSALEQFQLLSSLPSVRQAAVTIKNLPEGGLNEEGNYKYRKTYAGEYQESNKQIGGQSVVVMTKGDGSEVTAFIVHGKYVGTVALTSSDQEGDLASDMNVFLTNWRWK